MPQVVKPIKTQVVTKDGECAVDISIELTININTDGLQVSATATPQVHADSKIEDSEDQESLWAIPTFGNNDGNNFKFGKIEKGE